MKIPKLFFLLFFTVLLLFFTLPLPYFTLSYRTFGENYRTLPHAWSGNIGRRAWSGNGGSGKFVRGQEIEVKYIY